MKTMKTRLVKSLAVFLSIVLTAAAFSGCGKSGGTSQGSASPTASAPASVYPLKTDVTLKYFCFFNANGKQWGSTNNDMAIYKELEKRTGVKIEFIENTSNDNFNMMVAAGDIPDLMKRDIFAYPGGPEKAISDGLVLKLNDYMEQYAPNLAKFYKSRPDIDKAVKTDSGSYYCFPFVRSDPTLQVFQGPMLRKDWLDELGLNVPVTIDDWYKVLTELKNKKGIELPLAYAKSQLDSSAAFIGAYGIRNGLYVDGNKVKYGPIEPAYKEFLQLFNKWYSEGLLDPEFFSNNSTKMEDKIVNGKTAAVVYNCGWMGKWIGMLQEKEPKADLVAAPYPTLKKGEKPKHGQWDLAFVHANSVSVSGQTPHKEIAMRWLDYMYSEEGHMLANFGIEGESYTMENGYPRYTDYVMKNPQGLAPAVVMANYIFASTNGPFIQDPRYMEQYSSMPQQQTALKSWSNTDAEKYMLPAVLLTQEENQKASEIITEVNNYVNSMLKKFITGEEPIANFDQFVTQIKKLGIEEYIQYNQAALERYNKR